MATITISRQYGAGGQDVALEVCRELGYQFFDKNVMAQVAAEIGLATADLVDFSERTYTADFLEWLFTRYLLKLPATAETAAPPSDEERSIALVQETVRAAYAHGNIVILGRGGQAILQDYPDVLHVRLEAPLLVRIDRVLHREPLRGGYAEAENLVIDRDRAAASYLHRFYHVDIAAAELYHLVINSAKWDIATIARLIIAALEHLPRQ